MYLNYHINCHTDTAEQQVICSVCCMIIPMGMEHLTQTIPNGEYYKRIRFCFKCSNKYLQEQEQKIKEILDNITNEIPKVKIKGQELKIKIDKACKICKFRFKKLTGGCVPYGKTCPLRNEYYTKKRK